MRKRSVKDTLIVKYSELAGVPEDITPSRAEQLQVQIEAIVGTIQAERILSQEAAKTATENADTASASAEAAKASEESAKQSEEIARKCSANMEAMTRTSESWAVGGTGTRRGEDTDNSKYYANVAAAEANRATLPPVQGVYNIVLLDTVTGDKYTLIMEEGELKLLGVAASLDAATMSLIDVVTGIGYEMSVEDGTLTFKEVS